jgi:hypothetical protein
MDRYLGISAGLVRLLTATEFAGHLRVVADVIDPPPALQPADVLTELAELAAWSGLSAAEIADVLAWVCGAVPGFPTDVDELAAIVRGATP